MDAYSVHPLMSLGKITNLDTLDGKYPLTVDFAYCCFDSLLNYFIIGYNKHYANGYGVQLRLSHNDAVPRQRRKVNGIWEEWTSV